MRPGPSSSGFNTLRNLLGHSGIAGRREIERLCRAGAIRLDGGRCDIDRAVRAGAMVDLDGRRCRVIAGGGRGRLQVVADPAGPGARIAGPVRVHAGYHKCLTEYCKKVYRTACRPPVRWRGSFRHFFHRIDMFYGDCSRHTVSSVSGQAIDLDRFDDIRVVRMVRDPRDMLVSGYFYHKRSAEHWCDLVDPTDVDWMMVNGAVPTSLPANQSLAGYLEGATVEEGLLAEIDFRRHHYASMLEWPEQDPRIRLFRYEDIVGDEIRAFGEIFDFLGVSGAARWLGLFVAGRQRASRQAGRLSHIRNPDSGQWRRHFTERVAATFNERYGAVLDRYGYHRN